jgi:putative DNA primase/helicase
MPVTEISDNVTHLTAIRAKMAKTTEGDARTRSIIVRPDALHLLATEGETALIEADAPFYIRGGLVKPAVDIVSAANGEKATVARLNQVDVDTMLDHLARAAHWLKFNVRKNDYAPTDAPKAVAATILARDGEWRFRRLSGVITTPTLRPDGTIFSDEGYDPATQLLLLRPPTLPTIPAKPTRDDAIDALQILDSLLSEFPFVDGPSRSVALSALITPVVRGAIQTSPLHVTSAPVAGSGKSYIIDIASGISTGERAPVMAVGSTEEETEKRLDSALLGGQPIISIDNVNGELGGNKLCQLIERPLVTIRPLGQSKTIKVESRATCYATGNNIRLIGDMTRRVIVCTLDPKVERPELRTFDHDPFKEVIADRGKFIAAALTIARAYVVAGCPGKLPALASFDDWSRIVRSALVWLGCPDPIDTMEAARADDPEVSSLRSLMAAWYNAVNTQNFTLGKLKEEAWRDGFGGGLLHPDLKEALLAIADNRGELNTRKLGHFLLRHKGRIVDNMRFECIQDSHAKVNSWFIGHVS